MGSYMTKASQHNDNLTLLPPSRRRSALAAALYSVDAVRGRAGKLGEPERSPAVGPGGQASLEAANHHSGRLNERLVASEDRDSRQAISSNRCFASPLRLLRAAIRAWTFTKAPLLSASGGVDLTGQKPVPHVRANQIFLNIALAWSQSTCGFGPIGTATNHFLLKGFVPRDPCGLCHVLLCGVRAIAHGADPLL